MIEERKRTPDEWCAVLGAVVLDPDGWRGPEGRDWNDPITREEFDWRYRMCTVLLGAYSPPPLPPRPFRKLGW